MVKNIIALMLDKLSFFNSPDDWFLLRFPTKGCTGLKNLTSTEVSQIMHLVYEIFWGLSKEKFFVLLSLWPKPLIDERKCHLIWHSFTVRIGNHSFIHTFIHLTKSCWGFTLYMPHITLVSEKAEIMVK